MYNAVVECTTHRSQYLFLDYYTFEHVRCTHNTYYNYYVIVFIITVFVSVIECTALGQSNLSIKFLTIMLTAMCCLLGVRSVVVVY